jgi:hypothetical protein
MARSRLLALGVRALIATPLAVGLLVAMATPAHSGGGLTCRYALFQWPGGFSADLTIVNQTTATINGWAAAWTFDNATTVMNTWNGSITQSTPYQATARNAFYNAAIRPGSSVAMGWTALAPATEVPTDIVVNGLPCPVA